MTTPFVGEVRMFGFPRIPIGWLACDGSLQSIAEYEVLYTLIGTTYGGNGQTTFALPDLRGRLPLHNGRGGGLTPRVAGEISGTESVTLISTQMPVHTHGLAVSATVATVFAPGPTDVIGALAADTTFLNDLTGAVAAPWAPTAVTFAGGGRAHDNCMPTLTVSFCIATAGVFPQQQ